MKRHYTNDTTISTTTTSKTTNSTEVKGIKLKLIGNI